MALEKISDLLCLAAAMALAELNDRSLAPPLVGVLSMLDTLDLDVLNILIREKNTNKLYHEYIYKKFSILFLKYQ